MTAPDGSKVARSVEVFTSEGLIMDQLETTVVNPDELMASLSYIQANPPVFAVGDPGVKVPGWHIRAWGEALTRAEKTVGLSESSPAGRLYTIPLTK